MGIKDKDRKGWEAIKKGSEQDYFYLRYDLENKRYNRY